MTQKATESNDFSGLFSPIKVIEKNLGIDFCTFNYDKSRMNFEKWDMQPPVAPIPRRLGCKTYESTIELTHKSLCFEVLNMSLGARIRSLRTEQNMSQNDLAESLNVSRQSISKWETDGATPDLDKLVSLSEIFGVTLDELIKGAVPIPDMQGSDAETSTAAPGEKAAPIPASHQIAGIVLLCFGALITILLFLFGGGLLSLMFASPFLLCGAICLYTHKRTGLWCGWAVYLGVDLYLRYATGITWGIIWLTAQFTPEMNYVRLAIGWGQFLVGVLLIVLTLWSYRRKTAAWDKKHMIFAGTELLLLVGLTFGQNSILRFILARLNAHESVQQNLCFWVRSCGDYIRLWLFVALLVLGTALIRQYRMNKKT